MSKGTVNKQILVGSLGRDPEISDKFAKFSIATTEEKKNAAGSYEPETQWHNVVVFGNQMKVCAYMKKGTKVYVEGRTEHRKYTKKDGTEGKSTSVVAREVQILSSKEKTQESPYMGADQYPHPAPISTAGSNGKIDADFGDDIPF